MLKELCNQLCIRMRKYSHRALGQVAHWLASQAGLKAVAADAVLLPEGCRYIPKHFYDVDPAVLNQLKDGNRAILHQKMQNWQVSNERTGKHWFMKNDQWGTKSDPKHWHQEVFPFLTLRTVKAMIADLAEASLLVVDGAWCHPVKAEFSGAEQLTLSLGKDFQQPRKVFPSSIQLKSNSSKTKTRKSTPTPARAPRKAAVADFAIPETRNKADIEMHEHPEAGNDGHDELYRLPAALKSNWRDPHLTIGQFVERYGVAAIRIAWEQATNYENQIAGTRSILAHFPTPSSAPPPSVHDIAKADHDAWVQSLKQSKYRSFYSNADDFDDPAPVGADADPDATPDIDPAEIEAAS